MDDNLMFSIPAEISMLPNDTNLDFGEKNNFVTPVRLKVFYTGSTPDGRTFTEDFSSKVIKTLPQTPVVAYYDEDEEDFVGHNSKQYVYGYVPEVGNISFEEIEGQVWAVTDIVLFTGRDDNIGKVAKKIVGKKHSLELDRNSTKYELKKDNLGRVKEMIFTEGRITGLSVLGDRQTPGFTGSEFFTETEQTLQELIAKYADFKQELQITSFTDLFSSENQNDGGVEMNFSTETIAALNTFMKETYDEKFQKIFSEFLEKFGKYAHIIQMSEDSIVFMDFEDGQYYRVGYSGSDEGYDFSEKIAVKPRFLTPDEIDNTFEQKDNEDEEDENEEEEENTESNTNYEQNETSTEETNEETVDVDLQKFEDSFKQFIRTTYDEVQKGALKEVYRNFGDSVAVIQWSSIDNVVVFMDYSAGMIYRAGYVMDDATETLEFGPKVEVKPRYLTDREIDMVFPAGKNYIQEETDMSSFEKVVEGTVFTDEQVAQIEKDRAELEGYRREKKAKVVERYGKFLTKEETEQYMNSLDSFTIANLEKELSYVAMQKVLNEQEKDSEQFKATKITSNEKIAKSESETTLDLINRYK